MTEQKGSPQERIWIGGERHQLISANRRGGGSYYHERASYRSHTDIPYVRERVQPAEDERVKEIRERLSKATPGAWVAENRPAYVELRLDKTLNEASLRVSADACVSQYGLIPQGVLWKPDAEFIAHARADIEYLLSLLPVQSAQLHIKASAICDDKACFIAEETAIAFTIAALSQQPPVQPAASTPTERPYCHYCHGKGFITGLEHACPYCNPGGEFRAASTPRRYMQPDDAASAEAQDERNDNA